MFKLIANIFEEANKAMDSVEVDFRLLNTARDENVRAIPEHTVEDLIYEAAEQISSFDE